MGTWMRASAFQAPADLTNLDVEGGHSDAESKLNALVWRYFNRKNEGQHLNAN